MFAQNESGIDRVVRAILGVALLVVGFFLTGGVLRVVLVVVGLIALFTAATGFCLLYRLFRFSTRHA
jgi:hypothetical protein